MVSVTLTFRILYYLTFIRWPKILLHQLCFRRLPKSVVRWKRYFLNTFTRTFLSFPARFTSFKELKRSTQPFLVAYFTISKPLICDKDIETCVLNMLPNTLGRNSVRGRSSLAFLTTCGNGLLTNYSWLSSHACSRSSEANCSGWRAVR